jgi:hypothetical protein
MVTPIEQSLEPIAALNDFQTRFLYPFFFAPHEEKAATEALLAAAPLGRSALWGCADPRSAYTEETLDHVAEFLFSNKRTGGCYYLKIPDAATQSWFQGAKILLGHNRVLPVDLVPKVQIELFLSHYGVGVFSITLTPFSPKRSHDTTLEPSAAVEFNYRLAQIRPKSSPKIHLPHPGDDSEVMARLSDVDRTNLRPAPASDTLLAERVGRRGGDFTLPELIEELLLPLKGLGLEPIQPTLTVYSVARFGPDVDFATPETRRATAAFLSALTQVEEPAHAGTPPDTVPVANAVLNRRHRAAVGQTGAVHLVADQPNDHPFNAERVPRVRDKYFTQYLMALLQRLVVHRSIDRAAEVLGAHGSEVAPTLNDLRGDLLRFAVGGHFTQISTRHALHRYYRLARKGLDVPRAWLDVRRAVADLDAKLTQERQEKVADGVALNLESMAKVARDVDEVTRKMDTNLGIIAQVQRMIHYIEMAIVSVYFAHLWHMFADNESIKHLLNKTADREWAGDLFVSVGVIFWAAVGFGLSLLLGRILHGRSDHPRSAPRAASRPKPSTDTGGEFD